MCGDMVHLEYTSAQREPPRRLLMTFAATHESNMHDDSRLSIGEAPQSSEGQLRLLLLSGQLDVGREANSLEAADDGPRQVELPPLHAVPG